MFTSPGCGNRRSKTYGIKCSRISDSVGKVRLESMRPRTKPLRELVTQDRVFEAARSMPDRFSRGAATQTSSGNVVAQDYVVAASLDTGPRRRDRDRMGTVPRDIGLESREQSTRSEDLRVNHSPR